MSISAVAQKLGKNPANVTLNDLIADGMDYTSAMTAIMTYVPEPTATPAPAPAPADDLTASLEQEQQKAIEASLTESASAPTTQEPSFQLFPAPEPKVQLPTTKEPEKNPAGTAAPGTGATPALFPSTGVTPAPAKEVTTQRPGDVRASEPSPVVTPDPIPAPATTPAPVTTPAPAPAPATTTGTTKERSLSDEVGNTITNDDGYWDQFITPAPTSDTDTEYWDAIAGGQTEKPKSTEETLAGAFGSKTGDANYTKDTDANQDGQVNLEDVGLTAAKMPAKERVLSDEVGNTITQGEVTVQPPQTVQAPVTTGAEKSGEGEGQVLPGVQAGKTVLTGTTETGESGEKTGEEQGGVVVGGAVSPQTGTDTKAVTGTTTTTGSTTTNTGVPSNPPPGTPPRDDKQEPQPRPGDVRVTDSSTFTPAPPTVTPGTKPTSTVSPEGNKVTANPVGWSPPAEKTVTDRRATPGLPTYKDANIDEKLKGAPGGTAPVAKEFKPGSFDEYLGGRSAETKAAGEELFNQAWGANRGDANYNQDIDLNNDGTIGLDDLIMHASKPANPNYTKGDPSQVLTPDEIAEQASRLREMRTMRERAQLELDRDAATKRYDQQIADAGAGKDQELAELDRALQEQMGRIQAMAIRGGLAGAGTLNSNIPIERDFNPLLYDYSKLRSGVGERIQSKINQLRLEASLGDAESARRLADLEREGGLIEEQAGDDLFARERNWGETVRGNRFDEFMGIENLERVAGQDYFNNQTTEAQMQEAIRSGRMDEYLKQIGLDRDASRQKFSDEMDLNSLLEQQRQADINRNLQEGNQYLNEYLGRNNVNMDLAKFLEGQKSSELERDLSRAGNERENLMSPIEQELRQAQRDNALAEAARNKAAAERGGLDLFESTELTTALTQAIQVEINTLNSTTATPQQKAAAQAALSQYEATWDVINPKIPFKQRWGPAMNAQTASPSPVINEARKAEAQKRISELDSEIAKVEASYQESAKDPGWLKTWGKTIENTIKRKREEREALKQQYGL